MMHKFHKMNPVELFHKIFELTNDISISTNIFLVHTKNRNGCIIEKEEYKTKETYDILYNLLQEYFIVFVNKENELIIPSNSLLVLVNSDENNSKISDGINELDIGELISYPCPNDNFDYENRKYSCCVYVIKNNTKHNILHVLCNTEKDKIFKNMVDRFQNSLNILNFGLLVQYHRNRVGNDNTINMIIDKLKKNKNIKKKFERETILSYFDSKHLIFVVHCREKLKLNIYKYKKMLLTLLTYCKYISVFIPHKDDMEEEHKKYMFSSYNKIFVYQLEIIKIFMNYEFDNETINKIINEYLIDCNRISKDEKFEINYKI